MLPIGQYRPSWKVASLVAIREPEACRRGARAGEQQWHRVEKERIGWEGAGQREQSGQYVGVPKG